MNDLFIHYFERCKFTNDKELFCVDSKNEMN